MATSFYGGAFFGGEFFNSGTPPVVVNEPASGVDGWKKKKRRTIRFSDLDARERLEAKQEIVAALAPPIEQAAVNLSEARGEETEDDELILMALTRLLH